MKAIVKTAISIAILFVISLPITAQENNVQAIKRGDRLMKPAETDFSFIHESHCPFYILPKGCQGPSRFGNLNFLIYI